MQLVKAEVLKELERYIDDVDYSKYNLADILISPLYLESIKAEDESVFECIKRRLYKLNMILHGFFMQDLPTDKYAVVICPSTYSHIKQLYPVAKVLMNRKVSYIWITNRSKLAIRLNELNENHHYFKGFYGVRSLFRNSDKSRLLKSLSTFTGSKRLKQIWKKVFWQNLSYATSLVHFFESIAMRFDSRCLIVGNDLTLEGRAATKAFKQRSLITTCIQHGEMSGALDSKHVVDIFFLYGIAMKRYLEEKNYNVEFVVSGAPYLDSKVFERNAIMDSRSDILIALSGPGNNTSYKQHDLFGKSIYRLACQYSDCKILIKLHPKDKIDYYPVELGTLSNVKFVIQHNDSDDIFHWLGHCKLLITGASMTAIEAMKLGVPVISMDYLNEYSAIDFVNKAVVVSVSSERQLLDVVSRLLNDQSFVESVTNNASVYADNYFHQHDKFSASEFIVERIVQRICM